jgi:transcriptional regulator with XRE-family HTH domain
MYKLNSLLMSSFSQWLKENRKKSGLTLEQLRSAIGDLCTVAYLSKLENDKYKGKKGSSTRPDREIVIALAEAFHQKPDEALRLADYANISEKSHIPDFLYRIDWQKFSPTALNEIKSFIEFKATYEALPLIKNGEVLQEDGELFVEFSEEEVLQLLVEEEKLHHKN